MANNGWYSSQYMRDSENEKLKLYNSALSLINNAKEIVVYDTETTGLKPETDRILQFSAVRYSLPDFKELDKIDLYINCPFAVPAMITKLNGISDDLLKEKGINEVLAYRKIKEFFKDGDLLSGYNIGFDERFLTRFFNLFDDDFGPYTHLDALPLARKMIPGESVMKFDEKRGTVVPKYNLETVTGYYFPDNEVSFHSSIEDVKATAMVLKKLLEDIHQYMNKLEEEKEKKKQQEDEIQSLFTKRDLNIQSIRLFQPSSTMKRFYINTTQGTFYFDAIKMCWMAKPGCGNVESVNMEELRRKVLLQKGVTTDEELAKLKG